MSGNSNPCSKISLYNPIWLIVSSDFGDKNKNMDTNKNFNM